MKAASSCLPMSAQDFYLLPLRRPMLYLSSQESSPCIAVVSVFTAVSWDKTLHLSNSQQRPPSEVWRLRSKSKHFRKTTSRGSVIALLNGLYRWQKSSILQVGFPCQLFPCRTEKLIFERRGTTINHSLSFILVFWHSLWNSSSLFSDSSFLLWLWPVIIIISFFQRKECYIDSQGTLSNPSLQLVFLNRCQVLGSFFLFKLDDI